jgi:hypothetical protein
MSDEHEGAVEMSQPTGTAAVEIVQAMIDKLGYQRPQPKTGPVMCAECGKEWVDCTCDATGVSRNHFAFYDQLGGAYKVWTCEGPVFVTHDYQGREQSLIFLPDELTRLAQTWLALQENDGTPHQHNYASTLDPKYEACSCGAARHVSSQSGSVTIGKGVRIRVPLAKG